MCPCFSLCYFQYLYSYLRFSYLEKGEGTEDLYWVCFLLLYYNYYYYFLRYFLPVFFVFGDRLRIYSNVLLVLYFVR